MARHGADDRRTGLQALVVALIAVALVGTVWTRHGIGRTADAAAPAATAPASAGPAATGPIVPVRLAIPAIDVDAAVEAKGTQRYRNPFTGQQVEGFGVPAGMRTVAWWSDGPRPGAEGMAVVLGHEQVGGGYGVFNRLTRLHDGDAVTFTDRGGAVLRFRVLGAPLTGLDKRTSALSDVLNGHPDGAAVALVTCGGEFDRAVGASDANSVVFLARA